MTLTNEVNSARQDIRTDDYAISIGEWIALYESGDLDIHPEFQRFFRWSDQQKSNLIESILLGIPLPPIFVSQRDNGVWDVIDGLQRLSTIFQLVGVLKDEKGSKIEPLKLNRTVYLPSLEGMQWETDSADHAFPEDLKRIIKRAKIHVSIILKESDDHTKYDLFQRLNTGGSQLSAQEVRNCILVMVNQDFYQWISELSRRPSFVETTAFSDKALQEAYDLEQVLRFLILTDAQDEELTSVGDLGVYINEKMIDIAKDKKFNRKAWGTLFAQTFDTLADKVGDSAFKRFSKTKKRHEGGFLVSQFETVSCGVAWNLRNGSLRTDLPEAIADIWSQKQYTEWAGSGITAARRLRRIIPFARKHFESK